MTEFLSDHRQCLWKVYMSQQLREDCVTPLNASYTAVNTLANNDQLADANKLLCQ